MDLMNEMSNMLDINSYIQGLMDQLGGLILLIALPTLIMACATCYFGYKIMRVLIAISFGFVGGVIGALLIGSNMASTAGFVIGFILGAAILGVLGWYLYKIGLFLNAVGTGIILGAILALIAGNMSLLTLGIIIGLILGVLVCIYTKPIIIVMTALNGASTLSSIIGMVIFKGNKIASLVLFLLFAATGMYVQFKFGGEQSLQFKSIKFGTGKGSNVVKNVKGVFQIVGLQGCYNGFEFDLKDELTFGRDPESCDILYNESVPGVSKVQCSIGIHPESKGIILRDNYSTYGTKLNGREVVKNQNINLNVGDMISFGTDNIFKITQRESV